MPCGCARLAEHSYAQRADEVQTILDGARVDRHPSALDPLLLQVTERRA